MVAPAGGASVAGSGTGRVTLTGTPTQINSTLSAVGSIVYQSAHDFFGSDTLTLTTNDNGNTGTGGARTDTDQVAIHLNTLLAGTPGPDEFVALSGNERIDALGDVDTITFGFKLTEATVTYSGNTVVIDGPSSHTVLTGFEMFKFTDGTVNNNDGDWLVDDLFYYATNHDVWNTRQNADAETHFEQYGWREGRDPSVGFDTTAISPRIGTLPPRTSTRLRTSSSSASTRAARRLRMGCGGKGVPPLRKYQ